MFKESTAMKELHKIRENHYEETKNMNSSQFFKHIHEEADKARKDLSLKPRKSNKSSA